MPYGTGLLVAEVVCVTVLQLHYTLAFRLHGSFSARRSTATQAQFCCALNIEYLQGLVLVV